MKLNHEYFSDVLKKNYSEKMMSGSRAQFRFNSLDMRRYFVDKEKSYALGHYEIANL